MSTSHAARRLAAVFFLLGLGACTSDPSGGAGSPDTAATVDTGAPAADVPADVAAPPLDAAVPADAPRLEDQTVGDDAGAEPDVVDATAAETAQGLPGALPFSFERPAAGTPLTDDEITTFTREVTGFWKDVAYFRWVRMHSHGMDPSFDGGVPDYALWWQDTQAIKEGDTVVFRHTGGADNLALRTAKVLNNTLAGYLMTGDEDMRYLSEQYCKGFAALSLGLEWGQEDPVVKYLQARAIFTLDHSYETVGGRKVSVDYGPVKNESYGWNAATIPNPENPHWGDIWVRNQRSKDDVPHMFRSVPMLLRAAEEAPDESVRDAARLALEYLVGFARDIVDSGYQIRTKFQDGVAVVPTMENGAIKDLASFVLYDFVDPRAECNAKLSSALVGYGATLDNDCGGGSGGLYETIASDGHYFNYAIIRFFHIAAVANALMVGADEPARALLEGLAARADAILHDESLPNRDAGSWWSDTAAFLLAAAAAGLPLTDEEAQLVREQYLLSVAHYRDFAYWDPWDASVPEGPFDYKPERGVAVRPTELAYLLEYCYSPFRNPAGARLVDCDVVADQARWGR